MDTPPLNEIDAASKRFQKRGYSHGYTSSHGVLAKTWIVYAHKGEHRITTQATTLAEAYRVAAEQVN